MPLKRISSTILTCVEVGVDVVVVWDVEGMGEVVMKIWLMVILVMMLMVMVIVEVAETHILVVAMAMVIQVVMGIMMLMVVVMTREDMEEVVVIISQSYRTCLPFHERVTVLKLSSVSRSF